MKPAKPVKKIGARLAERFAGLWRRRWVRALAWTGGVLVGLRVLIALLLPLALSWAAASRGLDLDLRSHRLSILEGELRLEGLRLAPSAEATSGSGAPSTEAGPALLELDWALFDLALADLVTGGLRVERAEVDGLRVEVERAPDGSLPWIRYLGLDAPREPEPDAEEAPSEPIAFDPPLAIDALRLQHVELHVADPSLSPPLDARFEISTSLSDLGSAERPARLSAVVHGPGVLESLRIAGEVTSAGRSLDGQLAIVLERLRLDPLRGALDALGVDLDREELAARARITIQVAERDQAPDEAAGSLEVADLRVEGDGAPLLELASLRCSVLALARDRLELALALEDGRAHVPQDGGAPIEIELQRLALGRIVLADPLPENRVALELALSAPGAAAGIFADATAAAGPSSLDLDAAVAARGIVLERLAPTLASLGLASELRAGTFEARIAARAAREGAIWTGSLGISDVRLEDGTDLLALERAGASDVAYDASARSLRIGEIELAGLACAARRDAQGAFHALGLRTIPGTGTPSEPAPSGAAGTAPTRQVLEIRSFALGKLSVRDVDLRFRDEQLKMPLEIATEGVELELADLALGGDPTGRAPARFAGQLSLPPLLDRATLSGEIATLPEDQGLARLGLDLALAGLHATELAPYLAPLGLSTAVADGRVQARLDAVLTDLHGVSRIALVDPSFAEGDHRLAGAEEIALEGLSFESSGPKVAQVRLRKLFLEAGRDARGRPYAAGFAVEPQETPTPEAEAEVPGSLSSLLPDLPPFLPRTLALDGEIAWLDEAVDPPLSTRVAASLRCDGLHAIGRRAARFEADLRSDQDFASLALGGQVLVRRDALEIAGELEGEELRSGALAGYLPAGVSISLAEGALRARFDARVAAHPEGGDAIACALHGLDLREAGSEEPLVALPRAALELERLDVPRGVVRLRRCEVEGLELSSELAPDGALRLAGVELRAAPPAAAETSPPEPRPSARWTLSEAVLERVSIDAPRLSFADRRPGGAEIRSALRLEAGAPEPLLAAEGGATAPLAFAFSGSADPLARELSVEGRIDPFAADPTLEIALRVAGIQGAGIAALLPSTGATIDGSGLADGVLSARVRGRLEIPQRARGGFDLARGFGAEIAVEALDLRDSPEGERLAGVDAIRIEGVRVHPARSLVAVKDIEIEKPFFRARRDAEGIHALGMTVRLTGAAASEPVPEPPATERNPEPPATATVAGAPAADPGPERAGGELAVARVSIRGLDVVLSDETARPVIVPLTDLDFELARFTTRAFSERKPISFHAYLTAGPGTLDRPLFEEVAIAGQIALRPELAGWMNVDLSALELTGLCGLADHVGFEIGGGTLDSSVRLRFHGAGGISVGTDSTFTDLSLSEPDGGPISRWLALPVTLDTVLFLLENEAGEHHVSVDVRLTSEGLGTGAILREVAGATASAIVSAVATSPLRLLGAVGIGGEKDEHEVLELAFEPGAAELGPTEAARLAQLLRRTGENRKLRFSLEHAFGMEDVALARSRANPLREDCLALTARLRLRKASLALERAQLAARARADLATGREADAEAARERLALMDADLGRLEDALDRIGELLRPGAERREAQRTKVFCVELGRERVARLRQALIEADVELDRIQLKPVKLDLGGAEQSSIRVAVLPGG